MIEHRLTRKMVSKRPAGPPRHSTGLVGIGLGTTAVLILTFLAFLGSSLLYDIFRTPAAAAAVTMDLPDNLSTDPTASETRLDTSEKKLAFHNSLQEDMGIDNPAPESSQPATISIERSSRENSLTWAASSFPTKEAEHNSANSPTGAGANMDFLPTEAAGQQYLWQGNSRRVLYHLETSRLSISISMDLVSAHSPAESPMQTGRLNLQFHPPTETHTAEAWPAVYLPMRQNFHSQLYETGLPNACGPAAALIVLDYYSLESSMIPIIDHLRAIEPRNGGYDPACSQNPVCTSPSAIARVFADEYKLIAHTRSNWSLEDVHRALQRGNPVIADIRWFEGGTLGHFVVIYGVDLETSTLTYHDPFEGAERTASWDTFSARWSGPVDVRDPLQPEGFRRWGMEIYPPPSG